MGANPSLIRIWLHGFGAFAATVAAFCVALSIAISGPPTAQEMAGVGHGAQAFSSLLRDLSARAAERICAASAWCTPAAQREVDVARGGEARGAAQAVAPRLADEAETPAPRRTSEQELAGGPDLALPRVVREAPTRVRSEGVRAQRIERAAPRPEARRRAEVRLHAPPHGGAEALALSALAELRAMRAGAPPLEAREVEAATDATAQHPQKQAPLLDYDDATPRSESEDYPDEYWIDPDGHRHWYAPY